MNYECGKVYESRNNGKPYEVVAVGPDYVTLKSLSSDLPQGFFCVSKRVDLAADGDMIEL